MKPVTEKTLKKLLKKTKKKLKRVKAKGGDTSKLEEAIKIRKEELEQFRNPRSVFNYDIGQEVYIPHDIKAFSEDYTGIVSGGFKFTRTKILDKYPINKVAGYTVKDYESRDIWWLPDVVMKKSENLLDLMNENKASELIPGGNRYISTDIFTYLPENPRIVKKI